MQQKLLSPPVLRKPRQLGLTLVELLVAMVLSLVIVVAASGVYLSSSQTFTSSDSASQLQDSSRFATYILRRMIQQAGYQDFSDASSLTQAQDLAALVGQPTCARADVCGFDNRVVRVEDVIPATSTTGSLPGGFFTDTVSVRFQGQSTFTPTGERTTNPDNSIIDCFGAGVPSSTTGTQQRAHSMLYVQVNPGTGDPELYCSSRNVVTGIERPPTPLIRGVESFQVVYEVGEDTEQLGIDPADGVLKPRRDGLPDRFRWVNAAELPGLTIHNPNNPALVPPVVNAWQSVVAVRFGLVLRSEPGVAPVPAAPLTFFPLGRELGRASDLGTIYVAPQDTRLRRVVTFTVHTRNRSQIFNPNAS